MSRSHLTVGFDTLPALYDVLIAASSSQLSAKTGQVGIAKEGVTSVHAALNTRGALLNNVR
jgi:hypothetical protein